MSSSDSNKKEDFADTADDPLVEIPRMTGNELIKKSQIVSGDIRGMVVRCTICLHQINHLDVDKCMKHFRLNVIVCKDCYDFYGTSEFSQDESGNYNYCTWCGNGGKLYLCDFCPHSFCSTCVRRNFGRAEVSKMAKEGWKCYMCNPDKLKAKVAYCELIVNYSKNDKNKKEKKATSEYLSNKISGPLEWTDTKDWVLPAFNDIDESCKSLDKRLEKLKVIGSSQSKSLRHVIKKMEQIVNNHKSELGVIMKSLSIRYVKFLEKRKQAEEKQKNAENEDPVKQQSSELNGDSKNMPDTIDIASDVEMNDFDENSIIDERNYKAKLALLEEVTSGSEISDADVKSEGDDEGSRVDSKEKVEKIVTDNHQEETMEVKKGNSKKEIEEVKKDKSTEEIEEDAKNKSKLKTEVKKGKLKSKTEEIVIEDSKDEVMEVDDASVQSAELFADEAPVDKNVSDDNNEEIETRAEPVKSSTVVKKKTKTVSRKLNFFDSEAAASSSSISDFEICSDTEQKKTRRKQTPKKDRSTVRVPCPRSKIKSSKPVDEDDIKLKLESRVVLQKCDDLLPDGETTIPVPEEDSLDELDKEILAIVRSPKPKGKSRKKEISDIEIKSSDEEEITKTNKKASDKKKKATESKKSKKISESSSSSICLSSSEDEKKTDGKKTTLKSKVSEAKEMDDANTLAKKLLLASDSDETSEEDDDSGSEEEVKKKKSKKGAKAAKSDSSDDFQPRKKKKFDKLLNKRILSDDDSSNDKEKKKEKQPEKKKSKKRKRVSEDENSNDKKEKNSDSVQTSTSESEEEKDKKKKKRKRIKKPASSSSENEEGKEKNSQTTPGKGRKNIKKILSKKDLATETKEAQNTERERKKRVLDRQKMYNIITDTSTDGKEIITRKMVLEVDPTSKEEIVEIHPELCEKLKPHQVKGVRFMWECTIESLKELEKGVGSGCILAHCMGLGKTLQVITFLHTCLTNEHVNKKIQTALVICPYNTVLNWSREFEHWLEKVEGDVLVHELTAAKDNFTRLDILKYWQRDGGVLIASYDIFRRLALDKKLTKLNKKNREKIYELLVNPGPDIVVCDEGHILKNVNSAISKACSQLATERRIVLTGTPLQNNLQEYHCMLSFVKPHLLGTAKEFRNRFVNPIINGQYDDSREYDVKRMKKRIHILHKLLDGCVQRCDYAALTKFLPPKHEYVIGVKLSEVQIKMYQHYLDKLSRHKNEAKIQGGTLFQDYNILRNLCTHPYIVHTSYERAEQRRLLTNDGEEDESFINDNSEETEKSGSGSGSGSEVEEVIKTYKTRSRKTEDDSDNEPADAPKEKRWYDEYISEDDQFRIDFSGKMVLLVEILKECEAIGDKIILFSQSLLTLDIIEDILNEHSRREISEEDKLRDIRFSWAKNIDYFRMDGTTSADFRKQYIDMFNNPANDRARLFLVSTKAGGLGTNLVGANRVIMMDASWNPSHDVQAIFRVYRFGQKKPVYIYRLLGQGTMEEKIYDRQVTKLSLSIRVVDEQQIDRHFNAQELAELYNFQPESTSSRSTPMVPKDTLLAEMLIKHREWIVAYHEHDSLLQNQTEEDLTEEERQAAWNEYENEREGRSQFDDNGIEEINEFSREPDFAQADYVGNMIPSSKEMIETIIANLKKRFPTSGAIDLRQRLLQNIYLLISSLQAKHVKVLRMKQEYVAKGSVPSTVNKYLDELNKTLTELNQHHENIKKLVQKDHSDLVQARLAALQQRQRLEQQKLQQQQQARFAQPNAHFPQQQQTTFNPMFTQGGIPRGGMPNFPPFIRMPHNLQAKMQHFPGGVNPGLPNFRPGDQRWNAAGNINASRQYAAYRNNDASASRQPVITEVEIDKEDANEPEYPKTKTSVVIEEID